MDLMVPRAGCDCEETRLFLEQFKNLRLLQFLVCLNESYSHVRSEILLKTSVLIVNQAYALAFQEESQRFKATRKPGLICDYCGYKGHLKENCYKIIGYPSDFKSKNKTSECSVKGYANVSAGEVGSSNTTQTQGHYLKEDQHKKLLGLLNKPDPDPGDCHSLMAGITSLFFKGLYSRKALGIGKEHNDLYLMKKELNKEFSAIAGSVLVQIQEDSTLWHMRLGHPSIIAMQHIPLLRNKVDTKLQHSCKICPLAKQNRISFQLSTSKTYQIFQLVCVDVWGPHKIPTYDRKYYFITLVDDLSRYTWFCLLQSKCEIVVVLKYFFTMVHNQFGLNVKKLRSDNGI
nr:uncharacterized protein LOC117274358 [Nicotiana tomentosiformis]